MVDRDDESGESRCDRVHGPARRRGARAVAGAKASDRTGARGLCITEHVLAWERLIDDELVDDGVRFALLLDEGATDPWLIRDRVDELTDQRVRLSRAANAPVSDAELDRRKIAIDQRSELEGHLGRPGTRRFRARSDRRQRVRSAARHLADPDVAQSVDPRQDPALRAVERSDEINGRVDRREAVTGEEDTCLGQRTGRRHSDLWVPGGSGHEAGCRRVCRRLGRGASKRHDRSAHDQDEGDRDRGCDDLPEGGSMWKHRSQATWTTRPQHRNSGLTRD